MKLRVPLLAFACAAAAFGSAAPSPKNGTITVVAPANYTIHSYRGTPDLGLTLAMVEAGGGPKRFDSVRLLRVIGGPQAQSEFAKLQREYGKAKMAAFEQTFTFAVRDTSTVFALNHITLPSQPRISPHDGRRMAIEIYRDGIMPTGKFDCGYMMEHMITHGVHIVVMHDVDVARGQGPAHNANFHIIFTRLIADLHRTLG